MTQPDISVAQIEAIPLFNGLPASLLAQVAKASTETWYDKGAVLFLRGDHPKALFAVLSGTVKAACQSASGGEKVVDLLGPGRVFGESALLLGCPYPYLAAAATPARLLQIDGQALLDLLDTSPTLSLRLMVNVSESIGSLVRDLEDYTMFTTHKRIARFLMERRSETEPPSQPVHLSVPKRLFASRLGMTPESFARTMRDLSEAGMIAAHKQWIRVIDGKRLALLADSPMPWYCSQSSSGG